MEQAFQTIAKNALQQVSILLYASACPRLERRLTLFFDFNRTGVGRGNVQRIPGPDQDHKRRTQEGRVPMLNELDCPFRTTIQLVSHRPALWCTEEVLVDSHL